MSFVLPLAGLAAADRPRVGGKAASLARLMAAGLTVPDGVCLPVAAYRRYVAATGLASDIAVELGRKRFEDMRWEELWDAALRIRSRFLRTPLPPDLDGALRGPLEAAFGDRPVAVRSSAVGEDGEGTSFAGLHESFVGVAGVAAVLEHVRLVWASLWSDRALLYRRELGLDVAASAIAVVVQSLVDGERSGVAFSASPTDPDEAVVEAVWGRNAGLVDGAVQPDRWHLDAASGAILRHDPPERRDALLAAPGGARVHRLDDDRAVRPPLAPPDVAQVFAATRRIAALFGAPADVEWTIAGGALHVLQARPITTGRQDDGGRAFYLGLHRSLAELQRLRRSVEEESLPAMARDAAEAAAVEPAALDDEALTAEIRRRKALRDGWIDVYWRDFIPLAHGVRLFGQVYNDHVRPEDPFEFVDLLRQAGLLAVERNAALAELAAVARGADPEALAAAADAFLDRFGSAIGGGRGRDVERRGLLRVVRRLAAQPAVDTPAPPDRDALEARYLASFPPDERAAAAELLALGRASYRLRDDDNIVLGRVEDVYRAALREGARRVAVPLSDDPSDEEVRAIIDRLEDPVLAATEPPPSPPSRVRAAALRARQLVGQPAGPGLAVGAARVVERHEDLFAVEPGEILVCDAVDPNMTFAVPLVAAIVERRGGMLIHGAIIAREYGLPCVTGVPDATRWIATGDRLTVDGHLGIVIVERGRPSSGG